MEDQIRTVVVGSSLKPVSDPVVGSAARLAEAAGAELEVVHAFPLGLVDDGRGASWGSGEAMVEERAALERRLREQVGRLGLDGEGGPRSRIAFGPPHRVLVEEAHRVGSGLLVLGASERGGPLERVLGSTADRVVRKSTCPVLVTRDGADWPVRRVLAPVDLSPLSADALQAGSGLLRRVLAEAPTLRCLLVLNSLLEKSFSFRHRVPVEEVTELAERELGEFVADSGTGLPLECRVRMGEVEEGILEEIDTWGPDLVLMGTHGRGGFERFLIGSVAAGVIRRSPVSVLVIPPEAALRAALAREQGSPRTGGPRGEES